MKRTLVVGASMNPDRYAYKATEMLKDYGNEVVAFGTRPGSIGETTIQTTWPEGDDFDTVTLYINPEIQKQFEAGILNLKPRRVVFNPGTENADFEDRLEKAGIKVLEACTLVLLRTNQY